MNKGKEGLYREMDTAKLINLISDQANSGMHSGWWGLIVPGAVAIIGALGKMIVDIINAYRQSKHECPKHCITKKPLKSKKKSNAKPKG